MKVFVAVADALNVLFTEEVFLYVPEGTVRVIAQLPTAEVIPGGVTEHPAVFVPAFTVGVRLLFTEMVLAVDGIFKGSPTI